MRYGTRRLGAADDMPLISNKNTKKSAFKYKQMANSPGSSLAAMTEEGRMSSVS